jgi:hypothetical protein
VYQAALVRRRTPKHACLQIVLRPTPRQCSLVHLPSQAHACGTLYYIYMEGILSFPILLR